MTEQTADTLNNYLAAGRSVLGFYWKGGYVFCDFAKDFTQDPVFMAARAKIFDTVEYTKVAPNKAEAIEWMKKTLNVMRPLLHIATHEHRLRWVHCVWCLVMLKEIDNDKDNLNGIQMFQPKQ